MLFVKVSLLLPGSLMQLARWLY